jgi:uncharacterized protein (TIGR02452 family)
MPTLAVIAAETLAVIEAGCYTSPAGRRVDIRPLVDAARAGTCLYTPRQLRQLAEGDEALASGAPTGRALRIEVTAETTAQACRRLVESEGETPVALNFASARNPGGGFQGNARAQEEDLARASALYACLVTQMAYYDANRGQTSMLYTDHIIYSPAVPFFRDDRLTFLETPFCASVVTAPAPNAGEALKRDPAAGPSIRETLERRARYVLTVAAAKGQRCLVLGAWGCGVFRNDPHQVADIFARALTDPGLAGAFDRATFAIYDRGPGQPTLQAFADRFGVRA